MEYKHIEWHDKKYTEDLIIGIGHEVTQQKRNTKDMKTLLNLLMI
jgi:hypothetical protein